MSNNLIGDFLDGVRGSELLRHAQGQTDGQLLDDFVRRCDGVALEVLVRRHAALVWGICRRHLSNPDDAEDAFQATFVVLVRKAASIRSPELLAHWLSRVALKTACKARQDAGRRGDRERPFAGLAEPADCPPPENFPPEWGLKLEEELHCLPPEYRSAVVLCDLEGQSRGEAARRLGVPEGTVASRLSRARALLTRRLARRGVGVSRSALVTGLARLAAPRAVPGHLLSGLNATLLGGETLATGASRAAALLLADEVVKTMTLSNYQTILALVLSGLVLAAGVFGYSLPASREDQPAVSSPQAQKVMDLLSREEHLLEEHPKRFGTADEAKSAAFEYGFPFVQNPSEGARDVKTKLDLKTGQWQVSGRFLVFDWATRTWQPPTDWEAELSYSPFAHVWLVHKTRFGHNTRRYSVATPVTFRDLRTMPEINLGGNCGDDDLQYLRWLKALRKLSLRSPKITDAGLNHLRDLPNLLALDLSHCGISNQGLAALKHLPGLRTLDLSGTPITDEGLRHLAALPQLSRCQFEGARITGTGLRHLGGLRQLRSLDVSFSSVPVSLQEVRHLQHLQELNLARTLGITNESVKHLKSLKNLAKLNLQHTAVTEADWGELVALKSLRHLSLTVHFLAADGQDRPAREPDAVRKFKEAMKQAVPGCKVDVHYLGTSMKGGGPPRGALEQPLPIQGETK